MIEFAFSVEYGTYNKINNEKLSKNLTNVLIIFYNKSKFNHESANV